MLLLIAVGARADAGFPRGTQLDGVVVGVSDGDTLELLYGGRQSIRVRLSEIDAPEKSQSFGQVSKQSLSNMVYRKSVTVHIIDTDRYGRAVGRVTVNGTDVNLTQVTRGLAWAYKQYVTDPTIPAAEQQARLAKIGLWSEPSPIAPWLYRKGGASAKLRTAITAAR